MFHNIPINADYSENIRYNNPNYPAYIQRGLLSYYPNYRAVSHWHDDLEFILILDGNMNYNVAGSIISMHKGEGLFVNSRQFHYGFSDRKEECDFLCIILHPSLLTSNSYINENYIFPFLNNNNYPFEKLSPAIHWQNSILKSIQNIYITYQNEGEKPIELIFEFFSILDQLITHAENKKIELPYEDVNSVTAMLGFIQENYSNKISVREIANAGNCCMTKCNNLFNKYLHTSPGSYLNSYRLEKSMELLHHSSLTITQIAYECGFSNASYYCESFHKYYGKTPKTIQKEA